MKYPEFVITGCPRSGTNFMSELFTQAGYSTNHESFYGMPGFGTYRRPSYGEASWLAAPFFERDGNRPWLHIVRNPLKVVSSLKHSGFFTEKSWKINPYTHYVGLHMPEIKELDELDQYLFFWIYWNKFLAKKLIRRWKLEDIIKDPEALFKELGWEVKGKLSTKKTNSYKGVKYLALEDLKDCKYYDEFVKTAKQMGYDLI